jgi:choline dehydrogenase
MEADYIVVGAGSAGCVVAARLSETNAKVTLLEAGPRDTLPWIHIPAGMLKLLYHPVVNWNYSAEGTAGSAGRRIHWPRGRTTSKAATRTFGATTAL